MFQVVLVLTFVCGALAAETVPYIVGGEPAAIGQFPHAVSLQYNNSHFCGGSIINSTWILTAAHCLAQTDLNLVTVLVGTNRLSVGGVRYNARRRIIHSGFTVFPAIKNDIALLQVSSPIQFNTNVQPISIPKDNPKAGYKAQVSGWGLLVENGAGLPDSLQFLNVTVISNLDCADQHLPLGVAQNQICTRGVPYEGACNGDSGSGLVYRGTEIGIVSWGIGCARGKPDVYVNVFAYKKWIKDNTN